MTPDQPFGNARWLAAMLRNMADRLEADTSITWHVEVCVDPVHNNPRMQRVSISVEIPP